MAWQTANIDPKPTFLILRRNGRTPRILFSNGSRARLFFAVDALGCLRSLRARSALDGVSWVQRGSVEIAVGQRAPATQSTPSSAPSLGRRSSWELDSASCLVDCRLRPIRTLSRLAASHA